MKKNRKNLKKQQKNIIYRHKFKTKRICEGKIRIKHKGLMGYKQKKLTCQEKMLHRKWMDKKTNSKHKTAKATEKDSVQFCSENSVMNKTNQFKC